MLGDITVLNFVVTMMLSFICSLHPRFLIGNMINFNWSSEIAIDLAAFGGDQVDIYFILIIIVEEKQHPVT